MVFPMKELGFFFGDSITIRQQGSVRVKLFTLQPFEAM